VEKDKDADDDCDEVGGSDMGIKCISIDIANSNHIEEVMIFFLVLQVVDHVHRNQHATAKQGDGSEKPPE
jgi:hypothetical protein